MRLFTTILFLVMFNLAFAQQGIFKTNKDIGNPKLSGSVTYDNSTQMYTLKGAGANIWGQKDEHHYCYNKLSGDFILTDRKSVV